jgi:hypothetical protein
MRVVMRLKMSRLLKQRHTPVALLNGSVDWCRWLELVVRVPSLEVRNCNAVQGQRGSWPPHPKAKRQVMNGLRPTNPHNVTAVSGALSRRTGHGKVQLHLKIEPELRISAEPVVKPQGRVAGD